MNKTKLMIGALSSVLCLSLASCQTKPQKVVATGFEASRDAFNECFEKTFSHQNMTISYDEAGTNAKWTEKIMGNTSCLVEEQSVWTEERGSFYTVVSKTWSFVNEKGEKIVAIEETPWSEGARYIVQHYRVGETDYQSDYKSYIKYFDIANKLEEWIKPFTSTSEGKDLYEKTTVSWIRYNSSVIDPKDDDFYFYDVLDSRNYSEDDCIMVSMFGRINPKTELVTSASILVELPEGCGPDYGKCTWYRLQMTYDDVEKIDIPDISGWEDMTNK